MADDYYYQVSYSLNSLKGGFMGLGLNSLKGGYMGLGLNSLKGGNLGFRIWGMGLGLNSLKGGLYKGLYRGLL